MTVTSTCCTSSQAGLLCLSCEQKAFPPRTPGQPRTIRLSFEEHLPPAGPLGLLQVSEEMGTEKTQHRLVCPLDD